MSNVPLEEDYLIPRRMQACYVNTTHPDFIGGHRATALITERINAAKVPPQPNDPKNARTQVNNNKDLDVDMKKDEPSFFGSFFANKGAQKKKVGGAIMEAPPPIIRPQAALSERETMETEVISKSLRCFLGVYSIYIFVELLISSYFNIVKREMIDMVPKAITLTLVNHSKENLQRELLQELYKPEVLDELLKESEFVVNRRKEVVSMVQALNKAEECVHLLNVIFMPFVY